MSDLQLVKIKGNTYYVPLPTIIGLYIKDNEAILIDSSNNKDTAKKILKLLDDRKINLKLIINTHSNADHIGGNLFLKNKTGCKITATKLESCFIEKTILEPSFLYGANPNKKLKNKFIMAKECSVDYIIENSGKILDTNLSAIPLLGHYFDMIGVRTPDNVVFIADSLMPINIIKKYNIFFLYDIKEQLKTLQYLKTLNADYYVPSHYKCVDNIEDMIELNENKIFEISNIIKESCTQASTFDEIISKVCKFYKIEMDLNQYVLVGSTIKSYITFLYQNEEVEFIFKESTIRIKKTV